MSSLTPWIPSIMAFGAGFSIASLQSLITYWLARRPGVAMRWVRVLCCFFASFVALKHAVEMSRFASLFVSLATVVSWGSAVFKPLWNTRLMATPHHSNTI
ncbi:hypothetical protein EON83_27650 [bacterium]|nr:MAG: hypothetical protein EON83_27650 [bacterium]